MQTILYQAYADGHDGALCDTFKEAMQEYSDLAEEHTNVRLVKLYVYNNGEIIDQDILKIKGGNPSW